MSKIQWKPGTMIYPLPAVMVSCGIEPSSYNILTVAWTGTVCTAPPMTYISIRKERHSYNIIRETGEFVINLTTEKLAFATDFCGVRSGRDIEKFTHLGLTPQPASVVKAPLIKESPVNIECRVTQIIELGSHDMFLAEVMAVNVDEKYIDESGKFRLDAAKPICYSHGSYYGLAKELGTFGYSVMKPKTKRKREETAKKENKSSMNKKNSKDKKRK
ncbi:MAG TPA: flavin reductase family protein [Spirochaetota bacterium]|nr:flavin reductase family protein [Spirochaetota bacterium]HPR39208.1 flavin reductase family protein [Spirochaetota bacterium]HRX49443.1 flavin reductase family protein [Spirochaetota bacterium]